MTDQPQSPSSVIAGVADMARHRQKRAGNLETVLEHVKQYPKAVIDAGSSENAERMKDLLHALARISGVPAYIRSIDARASKLHFNFTSDIYAKAYADAVSALQLNHAYAYEGIIGKYRVTEALNHIARKLPPSTLAPSI